MYFRRDSTAIWLLCTVEFRLMRYSIFLGPFENLKRTIRYGKFDCRYISFCKYTLHVNNSSTYFKCHLDFINRQNTRTQEIGRKFANNLVY